MKFICSSLSLLLIGSVVETDAWIVTPRAPKVTSLLKASFSTSTSTSSSSSAAAAAAADNDDGDDGSTCTRRQWFARTTAAAAAGLISGATGWSFPSGASDAAAVAEPTTAAPFVSNKVITTANTCDAAVSVWKQPETGRQVYLLGTAHISSASAMLAGMLVDDVQPEAVFVELDAKRVGKLGKTKALNMNDVQMASNSNSQTASSPTTPSTSVVVSAPPPETSTPSSKSSSGGFGVAVTAAAVGSALKGMYGRLNKAGFNAGEEFLIAMKEGEKIGATIILGDRDVDITLKRLTEALQTDLVALASADSELEQSMNQLMPSKLPNTEDANFKDEMSAYVETMKTKENVKALMSELKKFAPDVYEAMVGERDAYMANGLDKLKIFPNIVAVMGIAHIDGVEANLKQRGWQPVPLLCKA